MRGRAIGPTLQVQKAAQIDIKGEMSKRLLDALADASERALQLPHAKKCVSYVIGYFSQGQKNDCDCALPLIIQAKTCLSEFQNSSVRSERLTLLNTAEVCIKAARAGLMVRNHPAGCAMNARGSATIDVCSCEVYKIIRVLADALPFWEALKALDA